MAGMSPARVVVALSLALVAALPAGAQRAETQKVQSAIDVFRTLFGVPEHEVPAALMRQVYGIAIIPDAKRIGFMIGGQRGKGVLVERGSDGAWSRPLFLTLTGESFGWQVGVQSADIVLFFRTKESVELVLRGKYTLGVDASVAAGSLGREAAAATDQDLKAEIYSYSRTRGIFAGLAVQGAALDVDYGANDAYYGRQIGRPQEVLMGGAGLRDPQSAVALRDAIAGYEKNVK
jgi:lipid-binding SYLF domain-containing protein